MISQKKAGFTLIEALTVILLLALLSLGVYQLITFSLKIASHNKAQIVATELANQEMEKIRNLPYDDVGTLHGIVHGTIPDNQTVTLNNQTFNINTLVQYQDDPYDSVSVAAGGTDTIPTDYKLVTVTVSWPEQGKKQKVSLATIVAPKGLETTAGGGTLIINVVNANGAPVDLADVHIVNNEVTPSIDFDAKTNDQGKLVFYGAPASENGYQITVTKPGYSTSYTLPKTATNPNPTQPNLSVLAGEETKATFAIDLLSQLTIKTIKQTLPKNWRVNTNVESNTTYSDQIHSAISSDQYGNLYFAWEDYRGGTTANIYGQKYSPSGNRLWSLGDVALTSGSANKITPSLATSPLGYSYVVWAQQKGLNYRLYWEKIDPQGKIIWGPQVITNSSTNQLNPTIKMTSPTSTVIVWQEKNSSGDWDIYAQKYDSDGNKIWSQDLKVNTNTDASDQYDPSVAVDKYGNLYFVWTDERNGNKDIYAQKYDSNGNKIWNNDEILNITLGASSQKSPALTLSQNTPYAAWSDNRNDNYDIYATKIITFGKITPVPNVALHIVGSKRIGENPIIYKFDKTLSTNSLGTLVLNNMEWDTYNISLTPTSTYTLLMALPNLPYALAPNTSQTITLYLK